MNSKDPTKGGPLTEQQQRLNQQNVARLQAQAVFGNERPKRREKPARISSILDLAETSADTPTQSRVGEFSQEISAHDSHNPFQRPAIHAA